MSLPFFEDVLEVFDEVACALIIESTFVSKETLHEIEEIAKIEERIFIQDYDLEMQEQITFLMFTEGRYDLFVQDVTNFLNAKNVNYILKFEIQNEFETEQMLRYIVEKTGEKVTEKTEVIAFEDSHASFFFFD